MKKTIIGLFLFLVLLTIKTTGVDAQSDCSFECRVETSSTCIACRDQGVGQNKNTDKTDTCSFACRVETSASCISCRNQSSSGSTNSSGGGGTVSDPTCMGGNGINTAIGCIPISDTNAFMGWVLGWAIGVGGGIAFLLIVYASFMVMTSSGAPDRLKAGQELLTSAISGLIMLVFSVFILKFIGIDILNLKEFGFGV